VVIKSGRLRARNVADKADRRDDVLAAALALFREAGYRHVTMEAVARRAGLAKGTPYLYFRTKEALFLELTARRLEEWLSAFESSLAGSELPVPPAPPDPRDLARQAAASLSARPELTALLGILHPVLEQNLDFSVALDVKRRLRARVLAAGTALERHFPSLGAGGGARLLLRMHALVVGLVQVANPSPVVREVLREPGMELFDVDLGRELEGTLVLLFAALR
jgi:AcrR family transcriptional regulator